MIRTSVFFLLMVVLATITVTPSLIITINERHQIIKGTSPTQIQDPTVDFSSLLVFRNGILQDPTSDYTISGLTIILPNRQPSDIIILVYRY